MPEWLENLLYNASRSTMNWGRGSGNTSDREEPRYRFSKFGEEYLPKPRDNEPHESTAQATYLLPRALQRKKFLEHGYLEGTFKPEKEFFKWKELKLLDPEYLENHPEPYTVEDGEGFTNMFQIGRGLGLEYGLPYPGATTTLELLLKAKDENILGKGFIIDTLNKKKPRRLWNALTGQYSILPWLVGGSAAIGIMNND